MDYHIFLIYLLKMAYYELCQKGRSTVVDWRQRVIFTLILKALQRQYILVLVQCGTIEVYELESLLSIGRISILHKQEKIQNILTYSACNQMVGVLTFRQIYLFDSIQMLEAIITKKIQSFEANRLRFIQSQANIEEEFIKFTNKQLKLINHKQRLCLKIIGRIKEELCYLFCQIKANQLSMVDSYNKRLKFEYKASIQSLDKDIILYQSYVNKSHQIKVHHVTYFPHSHGRDTEKAEDYEVYQFQQRCCVNSIQKISGAIICILTNTHFHPESQSNIILYNFCQKYAMCNLALKNFMIIEPKLSGFGGNRQITYGDHQLMVQCIGQEGQKIGMRQVCPLSSSPSAFVEISQSTYYYLHPKWLILHSQATKSLTFHRKISKKAIYLNWLGQIFPNASGIFSEILKLL